MVQQIFGFFWKLRLYIYIYNIDVWQGTYGTLQVVQLLVVICFGGYVTSLGIVVMLKGESCLKGNATGNAYFFEACSMNCLRFGIRLMCFILVCLQ